MPSIARIVVPLSLAALSATLLCCSSPSDPPPTAPCRPTAATSPLPAIDHVFIVVLENTDVADALAQPYLKSLSEAGAFLSNYYAITHPSGPNYLAMVGGDAFSVLGSVQDVGTLTQSTIADLIEASGKTWKTYVSALPSNCFLGDTTPDGYAYNHVPFIYFQAITGNPARCGHIVNATELDTDIQNGTLPNYALYIPSGFENAHNTGIVVADTWMHNKFPPLLANPKFIDNTLFIVTFDEGLPYSTNQLYTVFYGACVNGGTSDSKAYNHYSLLKTVETVLGLGNLGRNDATASLITNVWKQ